MRKTFAVLAALAAVAAAVLVPTAAQAHHPMGRDFAFYTHPSRKGACIKLGAPVAPADGAPRSWEVGVTLCVPFRWTREVDVLTAGSTYTRSYWDWPDGGALYSYVGRALADGRATVAYDRVGNGTSTNPIDDTLASAEITMASDAAVLHQLVSGVRALGYQKVNSVGHSYGSGVVLAEAKKYADVSTVILTGYLHRPSNPAVTAGNYPANQDDKFKDLNPPLDNGWLTTRVGARASGFHSPSSDPALIALDEKNKDLVSLTGLLSFLADRNVAVGDNISNQITVPVLVVNGQEDAIFCYQPAVFNCADGAAVTANEAPFYAHAKSFKVYTVATSGHDLALHPTAGASYGIISSWLKNL